MRKFTLPDLGEGLEEALTARGLRLCIAPCGDAEALIYLVVERRD